MESRAGFGFCHVLLILICMVLSTFLPVPLLTEAAYGYNGITSADDAYGGLRGYHSAMVVVDGNDLFRVVGVESYPAARRARKIAEHIIEIAKKPDFDPDRIEVREINGIVTIFADNLAVMSVFTEDAELAGDFTPEALANTLFRTQISNAVYNYRYERQASTLKHTLLKALTRTVLLVLVLAVLFWSFRKGDQLLEDRLKGRIERLESKSKRILQARQIWLVFRFIIGFSRAALVLLILYLFLNFVLGLFPWTRQLANTLLYFVIDPLKTLWRAFIDYLPKLFFLIIIFLIFRYALGLARAIFDRVDQGLFRIAGFEAEWAWPTYRIVRIVVIILGLIIAYPYIPGSGSEAFKGISLLIGVLFSLGSSSIISNIIAGYMMTYRRAFREGDRVRFGEHEGTVTDVNLLGTHIRSLKNEEIIIPNATIINGEVVNYTKLAAKEGVILHTTVGIGYEVPWRQVEAMLLMAAVRTSGLQRKSEPFVRQKELGDFGVVYELNAYCRKVENMMAIYSELHGNIQDVFNEYGVAIMTPHYVADTDDAKVVPKDKWYLSPARRPAD